MQEQRQKQKKIGQTKVIDVEDRLAWCIEQREKGEPGYQPAINLYCSYIERIEHLTSRIAQYEGFLSRENK